MKKKISILFTLLMLSCPWWNAVAEERNFPAGSLIIPMDSFYQPDNDGGILEAYGLVYYLLSHTDAYGEPDITVYWIINQEKVDIKDPDFIIEDNTLTAGEVVAKLYDHAGGTSGLTFNAGDKFQRITYSGGPWIVDATDVEKARSIIDQSPWSAVELHTAQVPFKAPVYRTLLGTPPKIALMNNGEDITKGNAAILEAYLRLAGICTDVYEVLTPNQIRDNALITGDYDFLWAPHWTGYDKYQADNNSNSTPDVEDIVKQVRLYLDNGKGLLAECASIEVFEHSQNGRFLSTSGFGHNGGTNDPSTIIYNDTGTANSQVGDYFYAPEGGHLHNWRPFVFGDNYQLADRPDQTPAGNPEVTAGNPSTYQSSDTNLLTRFTIDNTGWDYYVGGYADGDKKKGYVVYLGGHKYASCGKDSDVDPEPNVHTIDFEFSKEISNEIFTLLVKYNSGLSTSISFDKNDLNTHAGDPTDILQIDLTSAEIDKKKLKGVIFRNNSTGIVTIDSVTFSWSGGDTAQQFKKITDKKTDIKHYDKPEVGSGVELSMTDFTIDTASVDTSVGGCTNNDDCSWKNIAGVRYVLNTLFNISYQISNREFIRAAPVVDHPYLYQGSFEYPSFRGHFRRYDVTLTDAQTAIQWDTADNRIPSSLIRNVFTSKQNVDGTWSKVAFAAANIDDLRLPLDVTPDNNDDSDELDVITRIRGQRWNSFTGQWVEVPNKLGGIMHSAPVIVGNKDHISHSTEVAYVGDLYGMLHAVETATGNEKWAYIPQNLLGKLKNDRTDPNSTQNFAAVDGSPTAKDIYYDHDNDPNTDDKWRTILTSAEGFGGTHIFALDITDPDNWSVLWEATDMEEPGGGMGHSYITAIGKVKSPIKDVNDQDGDGNTEEIIGYEPKWMIFVSTGYRSIATSHGGINIFAFDLKTGAKLWRFSSEYADSVNDIPGAVTLFDMNDDSFVDRIYAGDMNGRLWELNALDGINPNGIDEVSGKQIPLYNTGIGYPISVSPAVFNLNGHTILAFGTGGTDWAADDQAYAIFAVDATEKQTLPTYTGGAGTLMWKHDLTMGEKVWSAPTIAAGFLFVATTYGSLESSNPSDDIPAVGEPSGDFYKFKLIDGTMADSITDIGKVRGSIYVDRQHAYLTTIDGKVIQIGEGNFDPSSGTNVVLKTWRQLSPP